MTLPAIFQLPSERDLCDRHASPEIQEKQIAYQSRPWVAYVHTRYTSGANRFHTLTEALEDIRERRARHPKSEFWFELTGPGGKFDEATATALVDAHAAKKGRPAETRDDILICAVLIVLTGVASSPLFLLSFF